MLCRRLRPGEVEDVRILLSNQSPFLGAKIGRWATPARSFRDTLPESQRHLAALKRHPSGVYKSSASKAIHQNLISVVDNAVHNGF